MTAVDCVLDCKARIGEGVLWDDRDQAVWWVDIEAPTLNRFDPATGQNRAWTMPSRIGCFAPREAGGFIVALEDGFHFFEPEAGTFSHIHDPEADKPNNRMNDGAVDLRGRLVAGTMCMGPRDPVGAHPPAGHGPQGGHAVHRPSGLERCRLQPGRPHLLLLRFRAQPCAPSGPATTTRTAPP